MRKFISSGTTAESDSLQPQPDYVPERAAGHSSNGESQSKPVFSPGSREASQGQGQEGPQRPPKTCVSSSPGTPATCRKIPKAGVPKHLPEAVLDWSAILPAGKPRVGTHAWRDHEPRYSYHVFEEENESFSLQSDQTVLQVFKQRGCQQRWDGIIYILYNII